jgi:L-amino acid N-acyltransferase YncA
MTSINQFDDAAINDVLKDPVGNHGRRPSLHERMVEVTCRVLRRLVRFRSYRVLALESDDVPGRFNPESCMLEGRVVRGSELSTLAGKHKDLSAKFISRTERKGDWCYAYFDGERLASYGWYSRQPTRVSDQFDFEFPDHYAYMYRGFTERDYRGARLHGHGMAEAARREADEGRRGLVGLIEAQNVASLRSADRVGFRCEGTMLVFSLFGHWMTWRTPGCRRHSFRLARR